MSTVTDQAISTRADARAFADAFAAADDAFTFGAGGGESRTLTLAELGDVLALDRPVRSQNGRDAQASASRPAASERPIPADRERPADQDALLTLDELGEILAGPIRDTDDLDFDFGTSAHERARRRTAARLDASPSARRRFSGPAAMAARGQDDLDLPPRRFTATSGGSPAARAAMADAAASAAERLAEPGGSGRFAAGLPAPRSARALPAAPRRWSGAGRVGDEARAGLRLQPVDDVPREADRRPRRTTDGSWERLRADPDRIAMWAVLLGILLVLIAFTSGSASAVVLPLLAAL